MDKERVSIAAFATSQGSDMKRTLTYRRLRAPLSQSLPIQVRGQSPNSLRRVLGFESLWRIFENYMSGPGEELLCVGVQSGGSLNLREV